MCVLLAAASCAQQDVPPDGEAVIVVDTNLPVPRVVSRLRIDVYSQSGTWIATRDDVRPDTLDWPVSFSVFHDDPTTDRVALVRLRAYPEGRLIRYTGIVRAELEDLVDGVPQGDGLPRLMVQGQDRTPEFEPDPLVTIDRVVRVQLSYGRRGRVRVLLDGACVGKMPSLTAWNEPRSCTDGAEALSDAIDGVLEDDLNHDLPTAAGTWGDEPCSPEGTEAGAGSERVCVPGGTFMLGDAYYRASYLGAEEVMNLPRPERVVRISRFALDRDEVSVARFRAALAKGWTEVTPVGVLEKDGPPGPDASWACTFSVAARDREDYPLSCVPWDTARAFCLFEGGDLPTEAQWEYAALSAGRNARATYPWGDAPPDCGVAVYGRSYLRPDCIDAGEGVQPQRAFNPETDSHPLGVMNLAGSLSEHVRDTLLPFTHECWATAPDHDPACLIDPLPGCPNDSEPACYDDPARNHGLRGGSWVSGADELRVVSRRDRSVWTHEDVQMGFRCAYRLP